MSYRDYKPNPLLVAKACELWCEILRNPKFDALGEKSGPDDDPYGAMAMGQMLASVTASRQMVDDQVFAKFRESLTNLLMHKVEIESKTCKVTVADEGWYQTSLSVDYHPDAILAQAGKKAGIPEDRWPWKTHLYLTNDNLSLSYGYGAELVNYYPFDGKWLVTTLRGSDISKVIEYLRGGKPEFTIIAEPVEGEKKI